MKHSDIIIYYLQRMHKFSDLFSKNRPGGFSLMLPFVFSVLHATSIALVQALFTDISPPVALAISH
jgi:hypothetical protein